jgi:tRNA 2-thiocytidine biosynthesis protein TtcA
MQTDDVVKRVHAAVGRALGRFAMLRPGDRVAVGVSGGKDSLTLLGALVAHRRRAPFPYDVVAVTIEQGKFKRPIESLRGVVESLGVEWVRRDDRDTLALVAGGVAHGCDVCSRHRRRSLYRLAGELGATVLALGHTADDCAESLLRNVLFNGRIASLPPVAASRRGTLRLIRPLVFVSEDLTAAYARANGLHAIGCVCGDRDSVRSEIRAFLAGLAERHPGVRESIAAALGNVTPYALFDGALSKDGADMSPAFAESAARDFDDQGAPGASGPAERSRLGPPLVRPSGSVGWVLPDDKPRPATGQQERGLGTNRVGPSPLGDSAASHDEDRRVSGASAREARTRFQRASSTMPGGIPRALETSETRQTCTSTVLARRALE